MLTSVVPKQRNSIVKKLIATMMHSGLHCPLFKRNLNRWPQVFTKERLFMQKIALVIRDLSKVVAKENQLTLHFLMTKLRSVKTLI